jgi:hypothetical protein
LLCAAIALSALAPLARAEDRQMDSPSLDVRWSSPIPANAPTQGARPDFQIYDAALAPDGRLVLVGAESGAPAVAFGVDESGPGSATRLKLRGLAYRIAAASDGSVWIGGHANQRAYVPGGDMSDVYLAQISRDGRVLIERTFPSRLVKGRFRAVDSLAVMQSGSIAAAARDGDVTWTAELTAAGDLAWEDRFGAGKGASIAILADHRLAVAAFEKEENRSERTYKDHIAVRVFNEAGQRLAETRIRQGVNTSSGSYYGKLAAVASGDAAYIASSWLDPFSPQPIEVAKMGADSRVLWRKMLPDSISPEPGRSIPTWRTCELNPTALPSGDALVACALHNRIHLYKFEAASGEVSHLSVPLPACHEGRPAKLLPFTHADGALWLFGTRPNSNVAASCTWLGRVTGWDWRMPLR